MNVFLDFIKKEKMISAMSCIVIGFSFLLLTNHQNKDPGTDEKRLQTTREIQSVGEEMATRLKENDPALVRFSLFFSLFLMAGIFVDVCVFLFLRRRPPHTLFPHKEYRVAWGLQAVFKAFVILFFSEVFLYTLLKLMLGLNIVKGIHESSVLMGITLARNGIVILYVFYLVARQYRLPVSYLGLTLKSIGRHVLMGITSYLGFFPLYLILLLMVMTVVKLMGAEPPVQTVVQLVYEEEDAKRLFAFAALIAILGPFFEEVFFRGFIYQAVKRQWGVLRGMVVVSVIFALMHAHWVAFLPIFGLSMMLCLIFETTGSLTPGILMHMTHNMVALSIMQQVKAFS
jgi:uncharacterized protein